MVYASVEDRRNALRDSANFLTARVCTRMRRWKLQRSSSPRAPKGYAVASMISFSNLSRSRSNGVIIAIFEIVEYAALFT